ncbi:hypothetical protein [Marinobacter oulmenensis]|uniref:Lipoprotein n=1 Tax=Marinobacter oulmenensis TaxID=643747 RepID=A0A840U921_9GAMM|nr:hypothetical protein [Marinobacter oulmenensis]MBB5321629.1 hypothetical protein [Marinobacter oulmenensis]
MRLLLFFVITLLTSCVSYNSEFSKAASYGQIQELNSFSPDIDKSLFIRLYQSPVYGEDCFVETHGVCQYQYFLTVSTYDEYPEINRYELAKKGEITNIEWVPDDRMDSATIEFQFRKYTEEALANNASLSADPQTYRVKITPSDIEEF